jgi:hypothetical protein
MENKKKKTIWQCGKTICLFHIKSPISYKMGWFFALPPFVSTLNKQTLTHKHTFLTF